MQADIGFHDFEIGKPQRLLVTVEIWLEDLAPPADDDPAAAWDYDFLRTEIQALAGGAALQSAGNAGPRDLPPVRGDARGQGAAGRDAPSPTSIADARGVGVEIASFRLKLRRGRLPTAP